MKAVKAQTRLVVGRAAAGVTAGAESIAEYFGFVNPLYEEVGEFLENNFELSIDKATLTRVDGMSRVATGSIGVGASLLFVKAAGSVALTFSTATVTSFLSGYAIGRGIDNLSNGYITRKGADLMCSVSGNC